LQGELHIVPDPSSNTLLVRASKADFELVEAAVREIDVRPLQVVIEVVIVEARRDQSLSFGLDAALSATPVGTSGRATVQGTSSGVGLGDLVVRALGTAGGGLDLTLRAAAARGDVEILSRPVLLAANNQTAQILVGSQRPFVQVAQALPTDAASIRQVVQYRDVGTRLSVRPTISADGYVMLEVTQEVNAATSEVQFSAPVISTRTVQTRLLVNDGQTAILGGLTDQQRESSRGGIPVLSSIPLLGALFGRQQRRAASTELFIFLTPRVIRNDDENAAAARRFGTKPEEHRP
jgi:general secretion pathway protein D